MGRSPSFCFSIRACAGNADEGDFSTLQEVKASPEKRRWSFRKKHARHHVPSNTVISEPMPIFSENQNREANADTLYSEKAPSNPEKVCIVERTSQTLSLPSAVVSSSSPMELTSSSTVLVEYNIPEHVVIVIQTSIRRCLAQNEFQKIKNVVKIQAAARGYLVRRQAAGTLRCIQAIVKMQALVRARHSFQSAELTEKNKLDKYIRADVVKQSDVELNKAPSTIRKLVSSAYACQLLKSTPRAKSIRISCDPLRPDSSWNWLERWMALTSIDRQKFVLNQDNLEKNMKNDLAAYDVNVGLHVISQHALPDSELAVNSPEVPEVEGNLITKSSKAELLVIASASDQLATPVQDNELQSHVQETDAMENNKDWSKREAKVISEGSLQLKLDGNPSKPNNNEDNFKNGARNELDDVEENGGKVVNTFGKSKNTTFAAVQAKFEELSSAPDSNRFMDYASSDAVSVSKSAHSQVVFISKELNERKSVYSMVDKDVNLNEKLSSYSPKDQVAASAYETEIYVSSLDISEDSLAKITPELRTSDELNHGVVTFANGSVKLDETKVETKKTEESSKNVAISVSSVEVVQVEEDCKDTYVDKPSPYRSPKRHTVVEDSPATPSNHISLHVRTDKVGDNSPARKKKSQLAVENSPTHLRNDSDARSSGEHLRKGTKYVKRPNSSGSDRSNHCHHEDRSSSNSLPSYMQLTESAKAKINTSSSQKSSSSPHHKDNLIKKRHSFPIGNEKQSLSPRMHSPKSQTPQDLKGNVVSSDISAERRWQL
ncbi:protein IQ-DOMAIN 32 [Dendrobium catenatum]|uniref:protein IQ-DOMAIN 32 n=1 Tax=Dendrobium catenatum TaxID=906689 RepID=UPI0009F23BCA|nr:protein IQ-DOMAIN 32 [Dendrobium catenatum]